MEKTTLFITLFFFLNLTVIAQVQPRYAADIQTIRQYDKIYPPPKDPILFVGSSSIRLWGDLERTFADYVVLNRGIGGAVIDDITQNANDLIIAYHPSQIVIYVGENDIPEDNMTSDTILQKTKRLLALIRERLPKVAIIYISMKPSPSREKYFAKAIQSNMLIRNYIALQNNMHFIDVYNLMLTPDGKPRPELFLADQLHMNVMGYDIWSKALGPYLLKK